ncbi:hypothetical protein BpHYR1_001361 [Brachionus plicatilis]|uniref:Uncharacterized protein n=1 Tax=Brachionus plicatilis TaxID=10195 RepID=A0A3M7SKJ5_BRAPC|nr:hypothetical protein BpHYR1_001361 [Brachionus plicatilis]
MENTALSTTLSFMNLIALIKHSRKILNIISEIYVFYLIIKKQKKKIGKLDQNLKKEVMGQSLFLGPLCIKFKIIFSFQKIYHELLPFFEKSRFFKFNDFVKGFARYILECGKLNKTRILIENVLLESKLAVNKVARTCDPAVNPRLNLRHSIESNRKILVKTTTHCLNKQLKSKQYKLSLYSIKHISMKLKLFILATSLNKKNGLYQYFDSRFVIKNKAFGQTINYSFSVCFFSDSEHDNNDWSRAHQQLIPSIGAICLKSEPN